MFTLLVLVLLAILVNVAILTIITMKINGGIEKIEMFCETFERMNRNLFEDQFEAVSRIEERARTNEDHLKTINKNVYLMARAIIGKEEDNKL